MDKTEVLKAIEDLLDESEIPMNEYMTELDRNNGNHCLCIWRKDGGIIPHMYQFSEIFNSVTQAWYVKVVNTVPMMVIS